MSETKHTPGPWRNADGTIVDRENDEIALVLYRSPEENDNAEFEEIANAQLIAVAPLMLEACRAGLEYDAAMTHIGKNHRVGFMSESVPELNDLYEKWYLVMRAAMAQLNGESTLIIEPYSNQQKAFVVRLMDGRMFSVLSCDLDLNGKSWQSFEKKTESNAMLKFNNRGEEFFRDGDCAAIEAVLNFLGKPTQGGEL